MTWASPPRNNCNLTYFLKDGKFLRFPSSCLLVLLGYSPDFYHFITGCLMVRKNALRNVQVAVCPSFSPEPFLLSSFTVAAIVGAVAGLLVAIFCILLYLREFNSFRSCHWVDYNFFLLYLKCCFSFALLPHFTPLWIASTTNTVLKLRNGQLPSLHDPLFGTYRNTPDNVVQNIGNVLESAKL